MLYRKLLTAALLALSLIMPSLAAVLPAAPVQAANYPFQFKFGGSGSENGTFNQCEGMAFDPSGNIYVMDSRNNRLQKFDSSRNFVKWWGGTGSGDGQMQYARYVAIDSHNDIYVSEYGGNRVQKFDSNGNFILKWGGSGSDNGSFNMALGICCDTADNIYVVDHGNGRVQKFDSNGNFLGKFGSSGSLDGQFSYPCGIGVDTAGNIFVADWGNNRVEKFDSSFNFFKKWGSTGSLDGQFNGAYGLAVDLAGYVYVCDQNNQRMQVFNNEGGFIDKISNPGSGNGQFTSPMGVGISPAGLVFISDGGGTQYVLAFSGRGPADTPWPMFHHDVKHTGQGTLPGALVNTLKWSYSLAGDSYNRQIESSPSIGSDGTIYFGGSNNRLNAVNPDGSEKWTFYGDDGGSGRVRSTPAIAGDGTIYIGKGDYLYAVSDNGTDGNKKWRTYTSYIDRSSVAIGGDGTLYVGTVGDGELYAIADNGTAGIVKWHFDTGSVNTSPAIGSDGTIYICGDNGTLWALTDNGTAGLLKWSRYLNTPGDYSAPAIAGDGTIYVGAGNRLYAVTDNGTAGNLKWSYPISGQFYSPAVARGGTIYAGSSDGILYAISDGGTSASLKWWYATSSGPIYSHPAIASDGTIYFGSYNGNIYALADNGTAGNLKWQYTTGNIYTSPAIGSGRTVYITSGNDFAQSYLLAIGGVISPAVTTDNATAVTAASVTLNATLNNDGGEPCMWRFCRGTSPGIYTDNTSWSTDNRTTGQAFSENVTGLEGNTRYYYIAECRNSAGTASGAEKSFRTEPGSGVCGTVNLAQGKPVTVLDWTAEDPANVVDGRIDNNNSYCYGGSTLSLVIDLGSTYNIGKINVYHSQAEGYTISSSLNNTDWTQRFSRTWTVSALGPVLNADGQFPARYIKVDTVNNFGQSVGIYEVEAYEWLSTPPPAPVGVIGTTNLALNKTVANKLGTVIPAHPPAYAVDGNASTDWLSNYNGSNIWGYISFGQAIIDLGAEYSIGKIVVKPSNAHYYTVSRTNAADTIHDDWVFRSDPDIFGTNTFMSGTDTFYPRGSFTARYLFAETAVVYSPSLFQTGLFEIEVYPWELVTTNDATLIMGTTAALNGTLNNDGGEPCQYRFCRGTSPGVYTDNTSWSTDNRTTGQNFSENITGLADNTRYYYIAECQNSGGLVGRGLEKSFRTAGVYKWVGVGIDPPQKILHVTGSGPGSIPLFQRGADSAGFIIERTSTNRWLFGINESPTLGYGFVISTIPQGTTSVPRLIISPSGNVTIPGALSAGAKNFRIDHPLYPADRYLLHSFVESPDMLNLYSGSTVLDDKGEAVVELPAYFGALNRDYSYQLDAVGDFAPLYVKQEVSDNKFTIAGGSPGLKVSWQVTGIRSDPYAVSHAFTAEQEKPAGERGFYMHPAEWGQ